MQDATNRSVEVTNGNQKSYNTTPDLNDHSGTVVVMKKNVYKCREISFLFLESMV